MTPHDALNRWIAEHCMGWIYLPESPATMAAAAWLDPETQDGVLEVQWNPAASWADAGMVIEKMDSLGWDLTIQNYRVVFYKPASLDVADIYIRGEAVIASIPETPRAVCEAAKAALEAG